MSSNVSMQRYAKKKTMPGTCMLSTGQGKKRDEKQPRRLRNDNAIAGSFIQASIQPASLRLLVDDESVGRSTACCIAGIYRAVTRHSRQVVIEITEPSCTHIE